MSRRCFLRSAGFAIAAGALLPRRSGSALAQPRAAWTPIGFSQAGEPLVVHHLGSGPTHVLLLGGQHGGPEANTSRLVRLLMAHFEANPAELPAGLTLDMLPLANPDGTAAGIRQYLSGVDPNRNWGGPDWRPDAYDSNGVFRVGLGGPEPFSDQETRVLADWVLTTRPGLVVNYHSAGGFMFGPTEGLVGEAAASYAAASGYWRPTARGAGSPLSSRASGTMNSWMRQVGLSGLFIELTTAADPELGRNLAGLRAALPLLASTSFSG